jgi:hypothetical protein
MVADINQTKYLFTLHPWRFKMAQEYHNKFSKIIISSLVITRRLSSYSIQRSGTTNCIL